MQHILKRIPYYGFFALLIYMPFHIFLSQSLSVTTGGLDAWKIGKDIVLAGLVLFTICLVLQQKQGTRGFNLLLWLAGVYGLLHIGVWLLNPDIYERSALLGTAYNMRLPGFLLLGYGAVLLNPGKFAFSLLLKIVLGVSTLVAVLGILQYFLPKDLLTHLGYSLERGARAAFFIDDNPTLPRVMSTLREPNALGAYMLVPIAALTALLFYVRSGWRRYVVATALGLHLVVVFLTHSRSAWLATALILCLVLWWQHRSRVHRLLRNYWPILISIVLLMGVALYVGRNTPFMREYVTHSTEEEVEDLDSNDYHKQYIREGVEGVIDQPLGHGPGTAGVVSIQNPDGGQLTENYYLQLAYEIGIAGLVVFVAINVAVYMHLLRRRDVLGIVLVASFWGYVLTNMLLHTWSNEAVAAQWWLLAGAALVLPVSKKHASLGTSKADET